MMNPATSPYHERYTRMLEARDRYRAAVQAARQQLDTVLDHLQTIEPIDLAVLCPEFDTLSELRAAQEAFRNAVAQARPVP
jgi:hypothetical protein